MSLNDALRTAAEVYNPDDTIDLLGLFIIGLPGSLPAIAALWVAIRGQRKGRDRWSRDHETLREIHEETVNSHRGKSNMREDLDKVLAGIAALQHGQEAQAAAISELQQGQEASAVAIRDLQRDVGGIREEIRTERRERIAGDERNCTCCRST
ncbi:hypothetical protein [Mycolicibacterium smegmatis]|uniref:hypothetical protein n=1 Tax=Mycolicibacterium smegmatis TaxID=1772 RepID=UPI001EFA89C3|nr:hypothetical protein [Mycolicibacterium smegmatis]ULN72312.1 hypothetical protein KZ782_10655 [Mycolicibacterium smegmatis]